jgi:hypothetical protein
MKNTKLVIWLFEANTIDSFVRLRLFITVIAHYKIGFAEAPGYPFFLGERKNANKCKYGLQPP